MAMNITEPHIDEILDAFFNAHRSGKKGIVLRRIDRVNSRLRECVEADGPGILVSGDTHDVHTTCCETGGDAETKAAACTGDDGRAACERFGV